MFTHLFNRRTRASSITDVWSGITYCYTTASRGISSFTLTYTILDSCITYTYSQPPRGVRRVSPTGHQQTASLYSLHLSRINGRLTRIDIILASRS